MQKISPLKNKTSFFLRFSHYCGRKYRLWSGQLGSLYRKTRRKVRGFLIRHTNGYSESVGGHAATKSTEDLRAMLGKIKPSNVQPNLGFWADLRRYTQAEGRPIFALAPMADVTDPAFRQIVAECSRMKDRTVPVTGGGPDVMWTEFVSADGLFMGGGAGREALIRDLAFTEAERPIVAQFFTSHPETMYQAARLATELGFDGIDINMGCPDKSIEKQGAGAGMIKTPDVAVAVLRAALAGAKDAAADVADLSKSAPLPVSVKTRLGYHRDELETWLPRLLAEGPAAITIHARTRRELSLVPARWGRVGDAAKIRDIVQASIPPALRTVILGNGDVESVIQGTEIRNRLASGADGVMIGRGIFGNPWLFDRGRTAAPTVEDRLRMLVRHAFLFEKLLGGPDGPKSFAIMKKHFKAYANGFDGAKELRMKLMETANAAEVEEVITLFLRKDFPMNDSPNMTIKAL